MLNIKKTKISFFILTVSFFISCFSLSSYSQTTSTEVEAIFILRGNTRTQAGKSSEGVNLELKKEGKTIEKIVTPKNGKYYLQMNISIVNKNNEYILYITQSGTVPKSISINTYISPEEFSANTFPRYLFDLEIKMIETSETDIIIQRASGRIHWDAEQHAFAFDQSYAKIIQKETDNTDKALADKKKKEEEELAKKKAEEEAKLKAEEDAKLLAERKAKEDADKAIQKNLAAIKIELKKKRMQDSLDSIASTKPVTATLEIKKFSKPISAKDVDENAFDGTGTYSINIAKKNIKAAQEKLNKKKASNLAAKYETNNTLTSLLNMADEFEKNQKLIAKSKKQ